MIIIQAHGILILGGSTCNRRSLVTMLLWSLDGNDQLFIDWGWQMIKRLNNMQFKGLIMDWCVLLTSTPECVVSRAGRSRGRSPRDRPAARQHTRELMSTTHTNPWLIPIITWYVRLFRQKTTSICVFPLQSPIKVLSNRSHFVLTSSCSRYWTTPQMAPAVLTAKPNSNTNTQGGAVSTLLALRSMCDPRGCKLFVIFSTDCNDNSQHSFKHSTIY